VLLCAGFWLLLGCATGSAPLRLRNGRASNRHLLTTGAETGNKAKQTAFPLSDVTRAADGHVPSSSTRGEMGCFASTPEATPAAQARSAHAAPLSDANSGPLHAQAKATETQVASIPRPMLKTTERDKAILKIKSNRDDLQNSLKRLEVMKTQDDEYVKEYLRAGDRERAKMLLRRKAIAIKREKIAINSLNTVDTMIDTLETQEETLVFYEALKESTKAIKSLNEVLTVEAMEDTVDKYKDEAEYAAQAQRVLYTASAPEDVSEEEMNNLIGMAEEELGTAKPEKAQELGETTIAVADEEEALAALHSADPTPSATPNVTGEEAATAALAAKAERGQSPTKPTTARVLVGA
jgi:hypothetical protein